MREALTEFVQAVRAAGVPVSLAEGIDGLRAATAAGVEREPLREALAAALVKDEDDRQIFDEVFDKFFSLGSAEERKQRKQAGGEGARGRVKEEP